MTNLQQFGEFKFPDAGLLCGSAPRGWAALAAELRRHPACDVPAICPDQMEITLAVRGGDDVWVERRGDGRFQRTAARANTLWFCPIGVREDSIRITGVLPEVLHLYIPNDQFEQAAELGGRRTTPRELPYLANVQDELVRQIGYRILRELLHETASGQMLVDQLSAGLVAHLVATYAPDTVPGRVNDTSQSTLDAKRLQRVLAYIDENLVSPLVLADLANVACVSRFHFARAFKGAMGMPPNRYVSVRRLELACNMLHGRALSLAEIALACQFSSQASFTRAFQRHMGMPPGEYRRLTGH